MSFSDFPNRLLCLRRRLDPWTPLRLGPEEAPCSGCSGSLESQCWVYLPMDQGIQGMPTDPRFIYDLSLILMLLQMLFMLFQRKLEDFGGFRFFVVTSTIRIRRLQTKHSFFGGRNRNPTTWCLGDTNWDRQCRVFLDRFTVGPQKSHARCFAASMCHFLNRQCDRNAPILSKWIYIYIICIGIYLSHIFSAFPFQCLPPITAISGKQQTATSGQKITEHKRHSEMTAKWQLAETAGRFQPLQRINVRSATIAPTSRPIFWNWNDPSKRSYGIQKPRSHDLTIPDRYDGRWPGYRLVDNW